MIRSIALVALCAALTITPAHAESAAPKNQSRLTSAASYVALPTVSASVAGGTGGVLTVDFGLDIPDTRLRTRATAMRPRLTDAVRSAVADYALTRLRPGGAPDPDQIATMAQTAADRALGAAGARVLIANVLINTRR